MALKSFKKENKFRWQQAKTFTPCRKTRKPWGIPSRSDKFLKTQRHRRERQRIRNDVEAPTSYKQYGGWEF